MSKLFQSNFCKFFFNFSLNRKISFFLIETYHSISSNSEQLKSRKILILKQNILFLNLSIAPIKPSLEHRFSRKILTNIETNSPLSSFFKNWITHFNLIMNLRFFQKKNLFFTSPLLKVLSSILNYFALNKFNHLWNLLSNLSVVHSSNLTKWHRFFFLLDESKLSSILFFSDSIFYGSLLQSKFLRFLLTIGLQPSTSPLHSLTYRVPINYLNPSLEFFWLHMVKSFSYDSVQYFQNYNVIKREFN